MRTLAHLVTYVAVAVALTAVAEWQNNVLMNSDIREWSGYLETLTINSILALIAFGTYKFFSQRLTLQKLLISQYTLWGSFGLAFEWFLVGHSPFSEAIQFIMFVYWAGVFATPMLFILPQTSRQRLPLILYIIITSALMIIGSFALLGGNGLSLSDANPNRSVLLAFIIFGWQLVYTPLVLFFFRALNRPLSLPLLLAIAIVAPFAEILTPKPFNFFTFLIIIAFCYRYALRG